MSKHCSAGKPGNLLRRGVSIPALILMLVGALAAEHALAQSAALKMDAPKESSTYDSKGKRDPFVSLRSMKKARKVSLLEAPPLNQRPPGLAGLLVDEVTVVGTVSGKDATIILLRGIDKFTYFARVGTRLFNGHLEAVEGDEVTFVRQVVDTRGVKRRSKVIKRLYTEEVRIEEGENQENEKS